MTTFKILTEMNFAHFSLCLLEFKENSLLGIGEPGHCEQLACLNDSLEAKRAFSVQAENFSNLSSLDNCLFHAMHHCLLNDLKRFLKIP